jgi:hypothetical protein
MDLMWFIVACALLAWDKEITELLRALAAYYRSKTDEHD